MVRSANRHGIVAALFALFVALFVLIPTIDASACAVELEPAHAATSIKDTSDGDPVDPGEHAICSHGHCHHGGATAPSSPVPTAMTVAISLSPLHPYSEPLASRAPSGLERPPRA